MNKINNAKHIVIISFIICFTLFIGIFIFLKSNINDTSTIKLYFGSINENKSVDYELRKMEFEPSMELKDKCLKVIEETIKGPNSSNLKDVFPTSEALDNLMVDENCVIVRFVDDLLFDSGTDIAIFKYCLVQNFCQIDEIDSVKFVNAIYNYPVMSMVEHTPSSIFPKVSEYLPPIDMKIYYVDSDGKSIFSDVKSYYRSSSEDQSNFIVKQLIKGPTNGDFKSFFNDENFSCTVNINSSICTVNINSSASILNDDNIDSQIIIDSIVNSFLSIEDVKYVKLNFVSDQYSGKLYELSNGQTYKFRNNYIKERTERDNKLK